MSRGKSVPSNKHLYKKVLANKNQLAKRIDEMAAELIARYKGHDPLFVCLLKGAAPFATKLMMAIAKLDPDFHPDMDYMVISTYGDKRTAARPKIVMDLGPKTVVKNRTVVLIDDVLELGVTAAFATKVLLGRYAKSVKLVVLVNKEIPRTYYGKPMLAGFQADGHWLTGMGMDDTRTAHEGNRWLELVAIAHD